jgi:hypothetical protein
VKRVSLIFCALTSICLAQTTATFEQLHDRGLKRNPPGVTLHIETKDKRTVYHASEIIDPVMVFTSARANLYTVITEDLGWGDEAVLQPDGDKVRRLVFDHGVACCSSSVPEFLGPGPVIVGHYFRLQLPPGRYALFLQTERVSQGRPARGHYGEGGAVMTSDILNLTVLPEEKRAVPRKP